MESIVIEVRGQREHRRCQSEHGISVPLKAWLLSPGINLLYDRSLGISSIETFSTYRIM